MRRDRDGSPLEQHDDEDPVDEDVCVSGWLGFDADERPVPCLTCRPHLAGPRLPALAR